jgi:HAD superfamily hydrolase (TIGR01509 family)
MKKPRAFIFDMDGTLIDSMQGWDQFGQITAEYYHLDRPDYFQQKTYHRPVGEVIDFIASEYKIQLTETTFWEWLMEAMDSFYETVLPKPGVVETLQRLHADGFPICVATATKGSSAVKVLDRLGLLDCCQFVLSCHELGVGKQQPDIYLRCAERLAFAPDEIVVVEDQLHSARTALGAGFQVAGVYDRNESHPEELRQSVHFWLDSLDEIYDKIVFDN